MNKVLMAGAATLLLSVATSARADDRDLCRNGYPDLICYTFGPGFHVIPQKPNPLETYYITLKPATAQQASSRNVVYGGPAYDRIWSEPSVSGKPDGSVILWTGTATTTQYQTQPGNILVGGTDFHTQQDYFFAQKGHSIIFFERSGLIHVGPSTTIEASFDGQSSIIDLVGYGKFKDSLRLVVDKPFTHRIRDDYHDVCLMWADQSGICLFGYKSDVLVPVYVDSSNVIANVLTAGKTVEGARNYSPKLAGIVAKQSVLAPSYF